ncbi:hypothetical protein BGZ99_003888 [Dissophora globulifera]|uniref:Uncharacterized protein n=1 Tax=Dissophora globulifera TaxID=979702 RepID=A0A9P6RN67_9FUNG|nr:hypothetical protein BGZ99_003888 [Dissophora globulifera]
MSCQLNKKDDLNDDNLATHTELEGNEGYYGREGVVEYLKTLAPSSTPSVAPAHTVAEELTTLSSCAGEVHHRRYRFLAHAQDSLEQDPQEQDPDEQGPDEQDLDEQGPDEQDESKSVRKALLTEGSRTPSIYTPSRPVAFLQDLISRAESSLVSRSRTPSRSALSTRLLPGRTLSTRILSSHISSNRSPSPTRLPLSPIIAKRKCGDSHGSDSQLSKMTPPSRGRDERQRDRPESTAAAVEPAGFKKSKTHHSSTGHMAVEMSAQFKNIRDCKIHIRK